MIPIWPDPQQRWISLDIPNDVMEGIFEQLTDVEAVRLLSVSKAAPSRWEGRTTSGKDTSEKEIAGQGAEGVETLVQVHQTPGVSPNTFIGKPGLPDSGGREGCL